jgi:hypothetical protein
MLAGRALDVKRVDVNADRQVLLDLACPGVCVAWLSGGHVINP